MTADEHHLEQIFVAVGFKWGCRELVELLARCDPRRPSNRIDHAPARGDMEPPAWTRRNFGSPTLERGNESLLHAGLDQVEPSRTERACERGRDGRRVLPVERVEIEHRFDSRDHETMNLINRAGS